MKRLFTSLFTLLTTLTMMAQGWPAEYNGVMLQGFYWNAWEDAKWTNLTSQADELSQYFKLVWVPNSAYANSTSRNMGYHPVYWFDHKSAFGTEAELRTMIQTFAAKEVGLIEDVVINHRASVNSNWLNFPAETYKGVTYQLTAADICSDDECVAQGYKPTGAADTGDKYGGARDLDHTGANVQKNVNAYLDFLLNDLGYVGFRYDYAKGFSAQYFGMYNLTAKPQFSVGECWDSKDVITSWIDGTKQEGVVQSAAFDFPMKYCINDAFKSGQWSRLKDATLANDANYARYAVTFVDNHDTGRTDGGDGAAPLFANVEAANAYILTMPGTPCVWLKHWQTYKTTIKRLIATRRAVGLHNQSTILSTTASDNGYVLATQGTKGNALLLLGSATADTNGYKLAVEGTCFKLYVSTAVDLSEVEAIKDDAFDAPACCVVNEGEVCAFFEAPTTWSTVNAYAWNGSAQFTGGWPGVACTKVGTNNGHNVYKWTYSGTWTYEPLNIIFNNGSGTQTSDLDFRNGGYYNESGALQGVVTGIADAAVRADQRPYPARVYTLDGRVINSDPNHLPRGIYVIGGKKVIK